MYKYIYVYIYNDIFIYISQYIYIYIYIYIYMIPLLSVASKVSYLVTKGDATSVAAKGSPSQPSPPFIS